MKKWIALLLAFVLSASAASANTLDAVFSPYLDENTDVHCAVTAQITSLTPYGEETIGMLNSALKNLSVRASILEDETTVAFQVAGEPVMEMTERATENGTELTADVLPNRTLTSARSALDGLLPAQEEPTFDLFSAIAQSEACYQQLTDAIKPYAEEKKANYKIKGVTTSKWSRVARLTVEQSAEVAPLIAQLLGCGMDAAFREQLASLSCGKGFVVALYQLKEGGSDVAVYMKGNITLADGKSRSLAYQWAFHTADGVRVDTYKFELTKSAAARDSRTISASIKRSAKDGVFLLEGESSAAIKNVESDTVTTAWEYDLSGKEAKGVRPITGSAALTVKTTIDGDTATESYAFSSDMKLTSSDGSGVLSGRVDVEQKTGKTVHAELSLLFDENAAAQFTEAAETGALYVVIDGEPVMPQSSLTQNQDDPEDYLVGKPPIGMTGYTAPEASVTVDLDAISQTERDALTEEMAQNLAGKLLIALAKLPPEDSALIRDSMTEEDYAAFLSLIDGL